MNNGHSSIDLHCVWERRDVRSRSLDYFIIWKSSFLIPLPIPLLSLGVVCHVIVMMMVMPRAAALNAPRKEPGSSKRAKEPQSNGSSK